MKLVNILLQNISDLIQLSQVWFNFTGMFLMMSSSKIDEIIPIPWDFWLPWQPKKNWPKYQNSVGNFDEGSPKDQFCEILLESGEYFQYDRIWKPSPIPSTCSHVVRNANRILDIGSSINYFYTYYWALDNWLWRNRVLKNVHLVAIGTRVLNELALFDNFVRGPHKENFC